MAVEKVLVIGMGQMGRGIAQVCAQAGITTYVYDVSKEATQKGVSAIDKALSRRVERGKLSEADKEAIMSHITVADSMDVAKDVDLVEESVFEDLEVKKKVFAEVGKLVSDKTIIGSNTSALAATPLAIATGRPEQFMIIHFHQPPVVMPLVEAVRALQTSEETAKKVLAFCKQVGKTAVEVRKDCPGFLTNRTMTPLLNEVYYCLYEGIASKEDIDIAFKAGFNWPMGALELSDFIGLDTMLHILEYLHQECGGNKYLPCPLLKNMVASGYLGVKSGKGFYEYKDGKKVEGS